MVKQLAIDLRRQSLSTWRAFTKPRVINHAGVLIEINDYLSPKLIEKLYCGDYEKGELKSIRKHLQPDDIVMELGAGLGFISLYCSKRIGSERVFAFEANPQLERYIRRNCELNGLFPNLEICLLSEQIGKQDFFIKEDFWSSSSISTKNSRPIVVPTRSLNDEIRRIKPTFLILDIEGGEYELTQFIDFQTIRKVAIELHPNILGSEKSREVLERFAKAGFKVTWKHSIKNYYWNGFLER